MAATLSQAPHGSPSPGDHVRITVIQSAKRSVSGASEHPLLVLCSVLFGSEHQHHLETILRRCYTLVQQVYGVGSWEHDAIDVQRAEISGRLGNYGDAALLLDCLIDGMCHNSMRPPEEVHVRACQLALIHMDLGDFSKAEASLLEILKYCHLAAEQRGLPITEMDTSFTELLDYTLYCLHHLEYVRHDFALAELRARKRLEFCEQAFGIDGFPTRDAYDDLLQDLKAQNKVDDLHALQGRMEGCTRSARFLRGASPKFAARLRGAEDSDEMSINEANLSSDDEPKENDFKEYNGMYTDQSDLDGAEAGPDAKMNEGYELEGPAVLEFRQDALQEMYGMYTDGSEFNDAGAWQDVETDQNEVAEEHAPIEVWGDDWWPLSHL